MTADDVRSALTSGGPVLDVGLAEALARIGQRRLDAIGLAPDDYSTERVMFGDPTRPRRIRATLAMPGSASCMRVEAFARGVPTHYAELGVVEADLGETRIVHALTAGIQALAAHPPAVATTAILARSLHPLRADDPAVDVSYSDPEIPFSIFVGVHARETEDEALRVAEAMLHETMHLQLSLAEEVAPLVQGSDDRIDSPWRGTPRPAQGVLHGLYVFRAVEEFLRNVTPRSPHQAAHVSRRLDTIRAEVAQTSALVGSADLSPTGRALADRLIG